MNSRRPPRLMTLAAMVVVSGCAAAAGSGVRGEMPRAVISQASGELYVTNSRDGQAIFQAEGLAPGRSVTGTVQLSNAGSLAGDLGFEQLAVQDQPGANGGRLSDAVHLDVDDVTGGSVIPVFAGQLGSLQNRALGNIAPGQARTYRFTASLPDGGAPPSPTGGDNAYAGSALTVRYSWKATAPDTGGGGGGGGGTVVPKFSFYVISKKAVKRGVLDVMVTCDRACTVSAYAQMPKAKGSRKALKTARRTATLVVPGKTARIRLKLSRKSKRMLQRALRKKRKVALRVTLSVVSPGRSVIQTYSKKVVVKRPTKKRR
jgi:spore coat-associated protein N